MSLAGMTRVIAYVVNSAIKKYVPMIVEKTVKKETAGTMNEDLNLHIDKKIIEFIAREIRIKLLMWTFIVFIISIILFYSSFNFISPPTSFITVIIGFFLFWLSVGFFVEGISLNDIELDVVNYLKFSPYVNKNELNLLQKEIQEEDSLTPTTRHIILIVSISFIIIGTLVSIFINAGGVCLSVAGMFLLVFAIPYQSMNKKNEQKDVPMAVSISKEDMNERDGEKY